MNISILEKNKVKTTYLLEDANHVIANTLRRLIIEEVPTLAIEDINFIKNGSALYDEILALRLGLIPLKTDLRSYDLKEDCKCEGKGCAKCQLNLHLKAPSGAKQTDQPIKVYAGDLKSQDPKVKPVYEKMIIVNLLKGQKLELEAVAVLGKGKDHTKWSPGLVAYRLYPEIKIGKCSNPKAIAAVCPKKVYEVKNDKLSIKNLEACDLCGACSDACKDIEINGNESKIIFTIESWGQLEANEMMSYALKILDKKLAALKKQIA